jgi:hypothetical protein
VVAHERGRENTIHAFSDLRIPFLGRAGERTIKAIAELDEGDRVCVKWRADNSVRIEEIENVQ